MSPVPGEDDIYLIDKSAYVRRYRDAAVGRRLDELAIDGRLAVCEIVALELLYSARNAADYERLRESLHALPWLRTSEAAWDRTLELQRAWARRGRHRRPLPDLIIAATAFEHGAVVLHYDHDFDVIAELTAQRTEWVAPRGSVC